MEANGKGHGQVWFSPLTADVHCGKAKQPHLTPDQCWGLAPVKLRNPRDTKGGWYWDQIKLKRRPYKAHL